MCKLQRLFGFALLTTAISAALTSCIEDGVSTSSSSQPTFSTDTLQMGNLFTLDASPTSRFVVYNRNDKGIVISSIAFADDTDNLFRMNVDGMSGREFTNVEIRANDSIFIFVEATLPENGSNSTIDRIAHINFITNGVTSSLPVKVSGRDVTRLSGDTRITGNTTFSGEKPYRISDSIVVEQGATLTLPAGAELYMHDGARIVVHGSLHIEGTAERQVAITGDRFGYVASTIPYEIMSGQWDGIEFTPTSHDNIISHASIRNATNCLVADSCNVSVNNADGGDVTAATTAPALWLINSQFHNAAGYVLQARYASVRAAGCEFSDAANGTVLLIGGTHTFNQCTFANYYLFSALGGAAVQFGHVNADDDDYASELPFIAANFTNCIFYGNGYDVSHGDLDNTNIYINTCLLKSSGEDDDHFIRCLWDTDPLYFTSRSDYLFDYRLHTDSPARNAGDASLILQETASDRYGTPRSIVAPTLGAYEVTE
jgi:hypothetical protein